VDELVNAGRVHGGLGQAVLNPLRELARGRVRLRQRDRLRDIIEDDHVGEGPTDVNCDSQ
jgi:hypothetical protein